MKKERKCFLLPVIIKLSRCYYDVYLRDSIHRQRKCNRFNSHKVKSVTIYTFLLKCRYGGIVTQTRQSVDVYVRTYVRHAKGIQQKATINDYPRGVTIRPTKT